MAIPLDTLARLEEFPVSQVEMSGNEWVTQYRGQILPLVRLAVVLEERRHPAAFSASAARGGCGTASGFGDASRWHSFGLVVERILDIVEARADVKSKATAAGGSLYGGDRRASDGVARHSGHPANRRGKRRSFRSDYESGGVAELSHGTHLTNFALSISTSCCLAWN